MSDRAKKIFLGICIIVPFFLYCYFYYSSMLRNAPYRFSDFESIELKYGTSEPLENQYSTETGIFHFVNTSDSASTDTIRLRKDDLLYLHRKAAEFGFWNLSEDMTGEGFAQNIAQSDTTSSGNASNEVVRFVLQFNYKEKSKTVTFDNDFVGHPKKIEAARGVIDEVRRVLSDARGR